MSNAARDPEVILGGSERRTLDRIFQHPLSHNLEWRDAIALFAAVGGAEERHDGHVLFRVGNAQQSMERPHGKDMSGTGVVDLRRLLERAGWSPTAEAPAPLNESPDATDLVVVVDHAGATVYRIAPEPAGTRADVVSPAGSSHVRHHLHRAARDADREEVYPDDQRLFGEVAAACAGPGRIVVIGHGKGQSNEAHHLVAWLRDHHAGVAARIAGEVTADLPHMTEPQLIELGAHALETMPAA